MIVGNPDRLFAQKLREARERNGLTQEQVAQVLGVSQELVSLWEAGKRVPSAFHLSRLVSLYGIDSESLFDDKPLRYASEDLFAFQEGEPLSPEVLLELREWVSFLWDYADFLEEEGELRSKGAPWGSLVSREPVTDLRRASGEALRVRERYGLGLGPAPELYAFLDEMGVLVYGGYFSAESGVWGALYRHPKLGPSVFVNLNTTSSRQALTLAHGLAHLLYHYHLPGIVCRKEGLSPRELEAERFANAWAAHFLVPGKALKEAVKRLGELSPETALLLANRFRVSYTFLLFRLQNEGLIGEEEREAWGRYRLEDLLSRVGISYGAVHPHAPLPPDPDLERYPASVLLKVRRAVEEGKLSVSGGAGLLRVDSTTIERGLLAPPKEGKNLEAEELEEGLGFISPGRKASAPSRSSL
jgi:Zn-dependent peptidase ImmA (M78 family)/transcriptional regulator with XRE-family HTH domain